MRPNYPISSKEVMTDFNTIQESLLDLIGYDSNPFDDVIEKNGELLTLQTIADQLVEETINNRLYDDKIYEVYYSNNLNNNYVRGVRND